MAGDWIKMRIDLLSHPKVVRILSATKSDKFRVIGGLHAVWGVFDTHSVDGMLEGYTPKLLDHVIGWEGFSEAMIKVGWLEFDGAETLILPEFGEHNGQSAKRRAEDQKRKREDRKRPQSVRNLSANDVDENGTREEKRREEENLTTPNGVVVGNDVARPDCPHQEIIAAYHELLPMGTRVRVWNGTRAKHLQARWREEAKRQSLDWWRKFFAYVAQSEFLTGRAPTSRDRDPFVVSLDWLAKPENFAKVIEGFYHRGNA